MDLFKKKPTASEEAPPLGPRLGLPGTGPPPPPAKSTSREMQQFNRGVDRDILALDREEAKLTAEMKKAAKAGDQATAKVLAKSIVQSRDHKQRLQKSKATMSSVAANAQATAMSANQAEMMKKTGVVMGKMNATVNVGEMAKVMQQFEMQKAKMDMAEDVMDDAFASDLEDGETDEVVSAVLDELGIDLSEQMSSAMPSAPVASRAPALGQKTAEEVDISDLQARFAALQ
eukprot:gene2026-3022_t